MNTPFYLMPKTTWLIRKKECKLKLTSEIQILFLVQNNAKCNNVKETRNNGIGSKLWEGGFDIWEYCFLSWVFTWLAFYKQLQSWAPSESTTTHSNYSSIFSKNSKRSDLICGCAKTVLCFTLLSFENVNVVIPTLAGKESHLDFTLSLTSWFSTISMSSYL